MGGGRSPCCDKTKVKKGPWSPAEDVRLVSFIQKHGHPNWRSLPKQAGLLRCGKSCRLRWINYLRPDVKRGNFTPEEEQSIIHLHATFGNKWSKIASQLPGRTDNEIKNVWNTHLKKRSLLMPNNNIDANKNPTPCSSLTSNISNAQTNQEKPSNQKATEPIGTISVDYTDQPSTPCSTISSKSCNSSLIGQVDKAASCNWDEQIENINLSMPLEQEFWNNMMEPSDDQDMLEVENLVRLLEKELEGGGQQDHDQYYQTKTMGEEQAVWCKRNDEILSPMLWPTSPTNFGLW